MCINYKQFLGRQLVSFFIRTSGSDVKESAKSAQSDTETLSEYYQEDQDGYVITQNRRSPDQEEIPDKDIASPTVPLEEDDVHCSMASPHLNDGYTYLYDTKSMEESVRSNLEEANGNRPDDDVYSDDDNEKDGLQVKFHNGAVTIEGTKYNPKITMDSPETVNKGPPPPYPYLSMQGGVSGMMPVVPGGLGPGVPVLPEHVPPEVLAMMNSTQINPMISGGISECESLEGNIAGCMPTETLQHEKSRNQLDDGTTLDTLSDTTPSRLWTPLPSKRPYVHSKKKNLEKGKMKLIAENTSNHGVYTSVLKLPWSKRTRTPKVDAGKHMQFTTLQTPKMESHDQQTHTSEALSTPYGQDSGGKKLRLNNQQPEIQRQEFHQQTNQPSFVFLPLPTGNLPTSQGIFIPTPNFAGSIPVSMSGTVPVDPHVAAAQSMMMVYPNTNINSNGKPVRKRGRPPKVPAMSKVAPEEKQMKFDSTSYPTFIPQPFPPAAIVLNVNNMLNTGNNVSASNAISNSFSQCEVSSSTTQDVQNIVSTSQKQDLAKPAPLHPSIQVPGTSQCFMNMDNKTCPPAQHNPPILPKLEPKQSSSVPQTNADSTVSKSSPPCEMKMVTTTAMANASTGALYQEMVLSSKSLVSVRPRRRQSTSEYLKSKSSDQNFICTSFRLRSLSSAKKDKKMSQYVPGMKRRGRPPKKRLENMFEGQMVEVNQSDMEDFNRQNMINLQRIREQREDYVSGGVDEKLVNSVNHFEASSGPNQKLETLEDDIRAAEGGSDDTRSYSPVGSPKSSRCYDLERGEVEQDEPNEMFHQLFHCKVCNDIVPVERKDEHYLKHSKGNNFCGTCGSAFQRVVCNDANGDPIELLKCENCEQASQNDSQGQAIFCPDCGESFSNPLTLKHHRQLEHPTLTKQQSEAFFRCSDSGCGKAFRTKHDLRAHVLRRHAGNQQVFCIYDGCSKKFQNDLHLQEHIKFKHSQTNSFKLYKCSKPGCEKEFESEQHMNIHQLIHRDEKPMKCQLCDYRCRQQSALVWHVRKHHPEAVPAAGPGRTGSSESSGQEEVGAREHDDEDTQ